MREGKRVNARDTLERVLAAQDLSEAEASELMASILRGECESAWIAGFLVALRQKGECVDELVGFARTMRQHATRVDSRALAVRTSCPEVANF